MKDEVRLIDANALSMSMYHEAMEKDSDMQRWDSGCWIRYKLFEKVLDAQPTVNAAPERTGTWSEEYDPNDDPFFRKKYRCSACNGWNTYGFPRYCPDCGAKMLNATALVNDSRKDSIDEEIERALEYAETN